MSTIHFLPVRYGDSFVIECDKDGQKGIVLVDGGPSGCGDELKAAMAGIGTPDLMILTHYDDDHIGGLTQYIKLCNAEGIVPAREVWANCAGRVDLGLPGGRPGNLPTPRSIRQGVNLARLLDAMTKAGVLTWQEEVEEGFDRDFPFAGIEVVSPTNEARLLARKKQEDLAVKMPMTKASLEIEEIKQPLEVLAGKSPKAPNLKDESELANAASIAVILRCGDLSILLLGDCYPHNVEAYLRNVKGYSEENPLEVDYVKVAHHGSKHNTSNELLDIIKCNHYIISTNGEKYRHPDRTSIAHILCHPGRDCSEKVHLYFNCTVDEIVKNGKPFIKEGEAEEWNFEIHECVSKLFALDTPAEVFEPEVPVDPVDVPEPDEPADPVEAKDPEESSKPQAADDAPEKATPLRPLGGRRPIPSLNPKD